MNSFLIYPFIGIKLLTFVSSVQVNDSLRHLNKQHTFPEECGVVKLNARITGGKEAFLGQFPWMARLAYLNKYGKLSFRCGGALLNPYYVLTAAHCTYRWENKLIAVRLGENFADTDDDCENGICAPPVQDINIKKLIVHPNYNYEIAKNDISLIRLQKPVLYNDFVSAICLPYGEMLKKSYISEIVEVAGWGVMDSSSEKQSPALLFVRIPVKDSSVCDAIYPKKNKVGSGNTQLCAGTETGEDSCTGDSGGPMMKTEYDYRGIKKYFVLGLVSFGKYFCGESPSVYTNVIPYVDWILDNVQTVKEMV